MNAKARLHQAVALLSDRVGGGEKIAQTAIATAAGLAAFLIGEAQAEGAFGLNSIEIQAPTSDPA